MGRRPAASGEFVVLPQGDELFRGHGAARAGERCSVAMPVELGNRGGKSCRVLAVDR